ncbi:MAG: prepilin-type N-terminal cleavage/methylation domain-containing protein [bacterium]
MKILGSNKYRQTRSGFTLTEVVIASSIAVMVGAAVMTLFGWCLSTASLCSKMSWSQYEAMRSGATLTSYIRNASAITTNDVARGRWLDLRFGSGTNTWIARLVYTNAPGMLRDGRMYLKRANESETIVARGMTEIMDEHGFTTPVFTMVGTNCVRIAYRISEPGANGARASDDEKYASCVRLAVRLRNN